MADEKGGGPPTTEWDVGGLHFMASFRREAGATLRVYGEAGGGRTELLRFDDFVDSPHYHAPGGGPAIEFDPATQGEPLEWLVTQVRDHLENWLGAAGFAAVAAELDLNAIAASADRIRTEMTECLPDDYVRLPGKGLQRVGS
jgi:hypothetical protein